MSYILLRLKFHDRAHKHGTDVCVYVCMYVCSCVCSSQCYIELFTAHAEGEQEPNSVRQTCELLQGDLQPDRN
jgi:hypothetical protein